MFNNVGEKIKSLAEGLFWIFAIVSIICGVASFVYDINSDPPKEMVISFIRFFVLCFVFPLFSLVSAWFVYGFGVLIEKAESIDEQVSTLVEEKEKIEPEKKFRCPKCKLRVNLGDAYCARCGIPLDWKHLTEKTNDVESMFR